MPYNIPYQNLDPSGIGQSLMQGVQTGFDIFNNPLQIQKQQLANALSQVQLKYADPMAQADLAQKQLLPGLTQQQTDQLKNINQYYGQDIMSQIGLRGAQAGEASANAGYQRMITNNPGVNNPGIAGAVALSHYYANQPGAQSPPQSAPGPQVPGQQSTAPGQQAALPVQPSPMMPPQQNRGIPFPAPGGPQNPVQPQGPAGAPVVAPSLQNTNPQAASLAQSLIQAPNLSSLAQPTNTPNGQQFVLPGSDDPKIQNNPMARAMLNAGNIQLQSELSRNAYYNMQVKSMPFRTLPVDQRSAVLNQGAAFFKGDYSAASQELMQDKTMQQIAQEQGYPPNDPSTWPSPVYPLTKAVLTQDEKRGQAVNEMDSLNKVVSANLAPYSQTIAGYSPKQVIQAISNQDPDSQARFLAAYMLAPDLASVRARALNAQAGITMMKELSEKGLTNYKIIQAFARPDVYAKAQNLATNWITNAVNSANSLGATPSNFQVSPAGNTPGNNTGTQGASPQAPTGKVWDVDPKTYKSTLRSGG